MDGNVFDGIAVKFFQRRGNRRGLLAGVAAAAAAVVPGLSGSSDTEAKRRRRRRKCVQKCYNTCIIQQSRKKGVHAQTGGGYCRHNGEQCGPCCEGLGCTPLNHPEVNTCCTPDDQRCHSADDVCCTVGATCNTSTWRCEVQPDNPCAEIVCGACEACSGGICHFICGTGQVCQDGVCITPGGGGSDDDPTCIQDCNQRCGGRKRRRRK